MSNRSNLELAAIAMSQAAYAVTAASKALDAATELTGRLSDEREHGGGGGPIAGPDAIETKPLRHGGGGGP